jgi:predicted  nucleic acid-binding Zn-ribbon protein
MKVTTQLKKEKANVTKTLADLRRRKHTVKYSWSGTAVDVAIDRLERELRTIDVQLEAFSWADVEGGDDE